MVSYPVTGEVTSFRIGEECFDLTSFTGVGTMSCFWLFVLFYLEIYFNIYLRDPTSDASFLC